MTCGGALIRTGLTETVGRVVVRLLVCTRCGRTLSASDAATVTICDDRHPFVVYAGGVRVECDTPEEAMQVREAFGWEWPAME